MSILVGGALLSICVYFGFTFAKKYKERESLFLNMGQFLDSIKPKIHFFYRPVSEILKEEMNLYDPIFCSLLKKVAAVFLQSSVAEYNTFYEALNCPQLKENEKVYMAQFFASLGKTDVKSQIATIEEYKSGFKKMHDCAYEEKKKFSGVYQKLGVLCGLMLFVIVL